MSPGRSVFVVFEDYGWDGDGPCCLDDDFTIRGFATREAAQGWIDEFNDKAKRQHRGRLLAEVREVRELGCL